jgi:hypothetical protein
MIKESDRAETAARAAPMAGPVPEDVAWVDIAPDGQESECWGAIWGDGPPLVGMKTWWVIPDAPEGAQGRTGAVVLIARASRRHQVGRDVGGRWQSRGGRLVDVGEYFRETDSRSRFNRTFTPPTHAVMRAPDTAGRVALEAFARVCEAAERQRTTATTLNSVVDHETTLARRS